MFPMNNAVVEFNAQRNATRGEETREKVTVPDNAPLKQKIIAALRNIYDPELPVNIYDLGLIYQLDIHGRDVDVVMTLTSPNCPVAGSMPAQVECAIRALDEVDNVSVELTWDPPWDSAKLSDEVKLALGLL
jgi:FeS assembly SUF system protein